MIDAEVKRVLVRGSNWIIDEIISRAREVGQRVLRVDRVARRLAQARGRDAILRKRFARVRAGIISQGIEDRPSQLREVPLAHQHSRYGQHKSLTLADAAPLVIAKPEGSIRFDRSSGGKAKLV